MTELYRGLLAVLTEKLNDLLSSLRNHIRSFNNNTQGEILTTFGFWNLMLEGVFTLFVIFCLFFGIMLALTLAITSYFPKSLLDYSTWLLKNTKNPTDDNPIIIKQNNDQEKK